MWNTPTGNRALKVKERRLFVHGVFELWTLLTDEEGEGWESGAPFFEDIPIQDRSFALLEVAGQLLGPDPPPKHHAWNEGAILAVFNLIGQRVEEEVAQDYPPGSDKAPIHWRKLVHEAWMERRNVSDDPIDWERDEGPHQPLSSRNLEFWDFKVLLLTDEILFDRDCEMDDFIRMPSEIAAVIMSQMGIEEEYYKAAPAITEADRKKLLQFLETFLTETDCSDRRMTLVTRFRHRSSSS